MTFPRAASPALIEIPSFARSPWAPVFLPPSQYPLELKSSGFILESFTPSKIDKMKFTGDSNRGFIPLIPIHTFCPGNRPPAILFLARRRPDTLPFMLHKRKTEHGVGTRRTCIDGRRVRLTNTTSVIQRSEDIFDVVDDDFPEACKEDCSFIFADGDGEAFCVLEFWGNQQVA